MEKNYRILTLITALAVILALMGVILVMSQKNVVSDEDANMIIVKPSYGIEYKEIETGKSISEVSKTNVVTSDYVRDLDEDANMVVMTEDGAAYVVQNGAVLVDGRLIKVDENSKSVYYVDEPVKSVSTE